MQDFLIKLKKSCFLFTLPKKLNAGVRTFSYIMLAIAVWAIGDGLVMLSDRMEGMILWTRFEYIGISLLPALWIIAIIEITGNQKWLTTFSVIAMFVIPVKKDEFISMQVMNLKLL